MTETTLTAELPDGTFQPCHSPSAVLKDYFTVGQVVSASEFVRLSRAAFNEATGRDRPNLEFSAAAASTSLSEIERWAGVLPPDTPLTILHIS